VIGDTLTRTDAERECLVALRRATGAPDSPMEGHGVRVFLLMERLAAGRGTGLDREIALCASLLHDVGLYPCASHGAPYVVDSRRYAEEMLRARGWPAPRLDACLDAIEYHHDLRAQWHRGPEAELLRRADMIEISGGLLRFGLPRDEVRAIFQQVPRAGFYQEIARLVGRALRERPASVPRIFLH
jgi:HD superfamily phosphohydrolase